MESHQQVKNSSEKQNLSLQSSPSSSPSHDFSFTISLSSSSKLTTPTKTTSSHQQQQQQTVDLSPADDIFFHGHLLPLHLLSHISPRTSTASIINDGSSSTTTTTTIKEPITSSNNNITAIDKPDIEINPVKTKPNNKSFSLFGLSKWRKGLESEQQRKKKLMSLDLSHAVKKYIRMLFQKRGNGTQFMNRRQTNPSSYSFSSSVMSSSSKANNNKRDLITRRPHGELFSAPASMRTSPTNSGHLRVSTAGLMTPSSGSTSSSSSDSTMEELQAAIQAAIAHCKNSCTVDRC